MVAFVLLKLPSFTTGVGVNEIVGVVSDEFVGVSCFENGSKGT